MTHFDEESRFVGWFRHSLPYITAFRGRTFVVVFGGEAVADPGFAHLIQDLALLNSLGVQLVLVHGARPQAEERLRARDATLHYVKGLRVTDTLALAAVKDAVGSVRVEIEALLSMGVANSPMAGARMQVTSGNFVIARPVGVRDGVDYLHTGEVRRVDAGAIRQRLEAGGIVLLSPLGYSPTGEVFNLTALEVATAAAIALKADKLINLTEAPGVTDARGGLVRQLALAQAEALAKDAALVSAELAPVLQSALHACRNGVRRAHLIDRRRDGGVLLELFTRDGIGTMITADIYEGTRQATIEDVGGILELIQPLEAEGVLVRRSRELLEIEIEHFTVVDRDGAIIACAALYPYLQEGAAELACLAVHDRYRGQGYGEALLTRLEEEAKHRGIRRLLVLTTRTAHWFQERGFEPGSTADLPAERQSMYNYQRKSKVFIKRL